MGRRTRRSSLSAVSACGMEQRVQVITGGVDAVCVERDGLGGGGDEADGQGGRGGGALRHGEQARGGFQRQEFSDGGGVEGQVQAGADADLQHAALGGAGDPAAVGDEPVVPHREVAQARQDEVFVEAHGTCHARCCLRLLSCLETGISLRKCRLIRGAGR